ncbi:MAG: BCD family MFS transporter [Myxococcota bacterium]
MNGLRAWIAIVRMGLVQTALGGIVVLCLSVFSRVMTVELALAASIPGVLVTIHHVVQLSRPRWGYGADVSGRRTPWIIGGMAVLALGSVVTVFATAWSAHSPFAGSALGVLGYVLIGVGVGAAGTNLLALLAWGVAPTRRAAAAATVWLMMIVGFIVTTAVTGALLDPFSLTQLINVTVAVAVVCFVLSVIAILGVERSLERGRVDTREDEAQENFRDVFTTIWADPKARAFTMFVAVSMLAYGMQDLILEPFAGKVFGLSPGDSTKLSSSQYQGAFFGMILAGAFAGRKNDRFGSIRLWTVSGCVASGIALAGLAFSPYAQAVADFNWPLKANVMALGFFNGVFAIAAISWMMTLAGEGEKAREGSRMGLWGAAQAVGTALGAFVGASSVDLFGLLAGASASTPFVAVFAIEAAVFVAAGLFAARMERVAHLTEDRTSNRGTLALAAAGGHHD